MAAYFNPRLMGVGASALIYLLDNDIVLKVPRLQKKDAIQAHDSEQRAFEILERYGRSPYLIPCIYRASNATFILRCVRTFKDVIDRGGYEMQDVYRWIGQLSGGAAFIKLHNLGHCDLRPDNLGVDKAGNLRIIDFGSALPIGQRLPVGTEPFARMLSREDGKGAGSYGWVGAYTECFAIGSIFYSFIRGYYPYANDKLDARELQKRCLQKDFPPLTDSDDDAVIANCWYGKYESIAQLEQVFRNKYDGTEWYRFDSETDEWITERQALCAAWINDGNLQKVLDQHQKKKK